MSGAGGDAAAGSRGQLEAGGVGRLGPGGGEACREEEQAPAAGESRLGRRTLAVYGGGRIRSESVWQEAVTDWDQVVNLGSSG